MIFTRRWQRWNRVGRSPKELRLFTGCAVRVLHSSRDLAQVQGPLARDAEDAALMLDAMVGLDPLWPMSVAPPWPSATERMRAKADPRGLRVAYVPDIAGIGVDPEIDKVCREAVLALSAAGVEVEETGFDVSDGIAAYKTLRGAWMVGQQLDMIERRQGFGIGGEIPGAGHVSVPLGCFPGRLGRRLGMKSFKVKLDGGKALPSPKGGAKGAHPDAGL